MDASKLIPITGIDGMLEHNEINEPYWAEVIPY
jgi:hypothetical protein